MPLPAHLPRQEDILEPHGLTPEHVRIGEDVTEELELVEARLYVRRIVRPKYVLKKREEEGILVAELPTRPIERGAAGAGLLSSILIGKFVDHLPLYRQIEQFKREGVAIPSSTISDWVTQCCQLLSPLYDTLIRSVKQTGYIKADESPIKVQDRRKKGTTHQGYMWVYEAPLKKQIVFDYQVGRGREGPKKFLKAFTGYLQSDGYIAYECFGKDQGITRLCCMVHARREYTKALENDRQRAEHALAQIQLLYRIEDVIRECRDRREQHSGTLPAAVIARYRRMKASPVLNGLKEWMTRQLTEGQVLPRSPIGGAIAYSLKRWEELTRYITDGRLEPDNNSVENAIRALALGRKNFLFAGSHAAAQRIAMMYSFMATCKKNGVEPTRWMKDVLQRIPDHSANKLEELLPGNWTPRG